jgi:DNA-binding SARP family transcriptional activator
MTPVTVNRHTRGARPPHTDRVRGSSRSASTAVRLLHLIASAAIVALLVELPPAMPDFGPSLATPLTTSTLVQIAFLLLWLLCLVLALVLLRGALFPTRLLRPAPPWAVRPASRRPRRLPRLTRGEAPAPRLVVARKPNHPVPMTPRRATPGDGEPVVARIALLGPVTIERVRQPRRASTVELLVYLALHEEGATSDGLLEAIWPEQDPRRTRPRLWQSVSEARRMLGNVLERHGDRYKLDRARVDIDAARLEQLLVRLDAAPPAGEIDAIVRQALALWRGDPLSGADYPWADAHVQQLESTLSKLADIAARAMLAAGDAHGSLRVAERGLGLDNLNETLVRITLEAEAVLGRREAVTERYEAFRGRLDERLGLEPQQATRMLYRELLSQE